MTAMVLATRAGSSRGNREVRFGDLSAFIPPPSASTMPATDWSAPAALRIPAVSAAVRLVADTLGSMVMRTYTGDSWRRQPMLDTPQARLFQDPLEGLTSFTLWEDVATSIEIEENAFLFKVKDGPEVAELFPLPAECMRVRRLRKGGPKIVEAVMGGQIEDVTADVIHIRGWSPVQAMAGSSTIARHGKTLRGAMSLEDYRGRYFDSDATPSIVLHNPNDLTPEQRADARTSWANRHQGPYGERVGVTWGQWSVTQLKGTMVDAQASELVDADVRDIARMFRIFPAALLAAALDGALPGGELFADLFWRFSLMGRARRIERALSADRDLFPLPTLYARFDPAEFLRGDIKTMAGKVHMLKQVGVITANEGRAELGYPPSDDPEADKLLATPVGGAPNPPATDNPADPGSVQ